MTQILGMSLPSHWGTAPLKHVTSFLNRGSTPAYVDNGPVRAIGQAANQHTGLDWERTRFHDYQGDVTKLKARLHRDDVIINSTGTGTLGRVGYFEGDLDGIPSMADSHITVARFLSELVHPRYSYYWMRSRIFQEYIYAALTVGATNQIELNRDRLSSAPIPLPSLESQRRIADFLDAETARIDRAGEAMRRQVSALTERRIQVLDGIWPTLEVPMKRLGYGTQLVTSGSRGWADFVGDFGSLFFRSANLRRDSLQPNLTSLSYVQPPSSVAAEAARSRISKDDVLVGITGANTGWTTLADDSVKGGNVSQHVCMVRPTPGEIYGRWLAYLIASPTIQSGLIGSQYGGTKTQLSLPDIRNLRIPVVPISTQKRIAAEVDALLEILDKQRELRNRQLGVLAERRQALITAAVTGQIDISTANGRGI
ncbi:restriction endonuclease subunit S [Micromonospora peucetia]|uniref:restriction endonuclease subunit S n=1 Tax=Micromonospora peucetia TaxID=47871 RepID=UPI0022530075|nr:restriction endonuclease subunit S [Micromonospora peucetia]MCX4388828.1 restriction endonuclease subunit S [Micromonospora peucetia]